MRSTAASAMTEAERFDEVAELLARGVQRHFAQAIKAGSKPRNSQVRLDEVAPAEAPCASRVLSPQNQEPAA